MGRHLPVKDNKETIVGVLDIARCLFDVIKRLDRMEKKADLEKQKKLEQLERDCKDGGANDEQIAQLRKMVMADDFSVKLFGGSGVPTLKTLVQEQKNIPSVNSDVNVTEAAQV